MAEILCRDNDDVNLHPNNYNFSESISLIGSQINCDPKSIMKQHWRATPASMSILLSGHLQKEEIQESCKMRIYRQVRALPRMQTACSPTAAFTIHGPLQTLAISLSLDTLNSPSSFRNWDTREPSGHFSVITKYAIALR